MYVNIVFFTEKWGSPAINIKNRNFLLSDKKLSKKTLNIIFKEKSIRITSNKLWIKKLSLGKRLRENCNRRLIISLLQWKISSVNRNFSHVIPSGRNHNSIINVVSVKWAFSSYKWWRQDWTNHNLDIAVHKMKQIWMKHNETI